jgi:TPR repeat protein
MDERVVKGLWIPIEIWKDPELCWNERVLLIEIDSFTSKDRDCFISDEHIADLLGTSVRNASRMVSNLIKKGYIERSRYDGRQRYLRSLIRYDKIGESILDQPMPQDNCTIWIIDLDNLDDYQNVNNAFKRLIFNKTKEQAEGSFLSSGKKIAQYYVAQMYATGFCQEKDIAESLKWYRKAAEQGHAEAQNWLGMCYLNGWGIAKDHKSAVEWLKKAAEQGNALAQFNLGVCYENGNGVEKNYSEAVKLYRKAAEQGDALAQCNLGICYFKGWGIAKDHKSAVEWFKKAAEQGNSDAQYWLGICYYKGIGVARNYQTAGKWFRESANQKNEIGTRWLRIYYYEHVITDYEVKWFLKATGELREPDI